MEGRKKSEREGWMIAEKERKVGEREGGKTEKGGREENKGSGVTE